MKIITVATEDAVTEFNRILKKFDETKVYPFIIGDDDDLAQFKEMIAMPDDGGAQCIAQAAAFDVPAWLAEHAPTGGKSWPKQTIPAQTSFHGLHNVLTQELKARIHLGTLKVDHPWEVFAKLGYGDWNDCPEPHIHVALHRYWYETWHALPVVISSDIVESYVHTPPTERKAALTLAREQYSYCYDIVEQGVGTISKLGSSLLGSKFWYFWWD